MKSNLVLLCAENTFKKKIAKELAESLDMNFVDVDDLINYELDDSKNIIEKAGMEYFKQQQNNIIKRIFTFENTIVSIETEMLKQTPNVEKYKKNANFIFLQLNFDVFVELQKNSNESKQLKQINKTVFFERQKYLEKFADIVVNIKKDLILKTTQQTLIQLKSYFTKQI